MASHQSWWCKTNAVALSFMLFFGVGGGGVCGLPSLPQHS